MLNTTIVSKSLKYPIPKWCHSMSELLYCSTKQWEIAQRYNKDILKKIKRSQKGQPRRDCGDQKIDKMADSVLHRSLDVEVFILFLFKSHVAGTKEVCQDVLTIYYLLFTTCYLLFVQSVEVGSSSWESTGIASHTISPSVQHTT